MGPKISARVFSAFPERINKFIPKKDKMSNTNNTMMTPFEITLEDSSVSVYWHSVSFKPVTGISMPGAPMVYRYSASRVGMF